MRLTGWPLRVVGCAVVFLISCAPPTTSSQAGTSGPAEAVAPSAAAHAEGADARPGSSLPAALGGGALGTSPPAAVTQVPPAPPSTPSPTPPPTPRVTVPPTATSTRSPMPATPFTVRITASQYGYVAAISSPGALCGALGYLPSGAALTAPGLAMRYNVGATGVVSWTYPVDPSAPAGTGNHLVTCVPLAGTGLTAQAPFTIAAPVPAATAAPALGALTLQTIDGRATLIANDGTYLGLVSSSRVAPESICNNVGIYGSNVGPRSIRNSVGLYGSNVSPNSAYNSVTPTPPTIVYQGNVVGYLTKNQVKPGGIDPDRLFATYGCSR